MVAKLLHTSDWHLGAKFYGDDRSTEYLAFFSKLEQLVKRIKPEGLLISGDLFDKPDPARSIVEFFEQQMARVHEAYPAMRTIIIAGNHDNGEWLESMMRRWSSLGIVVVGTYQPNDRYFELGKHIVELPSCVIAAAPYLTPAVFPAEKTISKEDKYVRFIQTLTERVKCSMIKPKPMVLMAHCYLRPKDSPRYVAKDTIGMTDIPSEYAYVALGHAHSAKEVDLPHIRYCGSPWPISANEHKARSLVSVTLRLDEPAKMQLKQLQNVMPLRLVPSRPREMATVLRHLQELPDDQPLYVALNVKRTEPGSLNERIFINEALSAVNQKQVRICTVFWTDSANAPTMSTLMREQDPAEELRHNVLLPIRKQALELYRLSQSLTEQAGLLSGNKNPSKGTSKNGKELVQQAYQGLVRYLRDLRIAEALQAELSALQARTQSSSYVWEEGLVQRMHADKWKELIKGKQSGKGEGQSASNRVFIERASELAGGVWRLQQMDHNLAQRKEELRKKLQTKDGAKEARMLSEQLKQCKRNYGNVHRMCSMSVARLRVVDQLLKTSLVTKSGSAKKISDVVQQLDVLIKTIREQQAASSGKDSAEVSFRQQVDELLAGVPGEVPAIWLSDLRYSISFYEQVLTQHTLDQQRNAVLQNSLSQVKKRIQNYRSTMGDSDPVSLVWGKIQENLSDQLLKEQHQIEAFETLAKGIILQTGGLNDLYNVLGKTAELFDHTDDSSCLG